MIGLVQYRTSFSSSLPSDTLVRGYVQLETPANAGISQHFPVTNELLDGTKVPVMKSDGVTQWLAVTPPQWLGPTIVATKDKPVRIVFHNLLPTGVDGDLFLPVDTTLMGSGDGPGRRWPTRPATAPSWTGSATRPAPSKRDAGSTRRLLHARTGPPCTCTAASRRGSATARRTSGSRRPARPPPGRRASASGTSPT